MNKKLMGLSLFSFLASIAGIAVSLMLLKEDVVSTAHTIFEYFPNTFGVTPSTSWEGAIILGVFVSILQIISASVAFSEKFPRNSRILATVVLVASGLFDNWTDVVFRSGNLTGDMKVATITTLAFYTFGSEIAQGLSWLIFVSLWRLAISDLMWGYARLLAGFSSISAEWSKFQRAAHNKEFGERDIEKPKPQIRPSQPQFTPQQRPSWAELKKQMEEDEKRKPVAASNVMRVEPTYHPVGMGEKKKRFDE